MDMLSMKGLLWKLKFSSENEKPKVTTSPKTFS